MHSEEIKLKLAYGYSMLEMGLGKALAITNEILLKDPTNLRAIMLSSNIHQKMGNIDIALEISRAIDHAIDTDRDGLRRDIERIVVLDDESAWQGPAGRIGL